MNAMVFLANAIRMRPLAFLVALATIMVGVLAGVYLKRPAYESSAKVLVNLDSRSISLSRAEIQYGGAMLQAVEVITSQVEILHSRKLLEATIDALGSETFVDPPSPNAVVNLAKAMFERAQDDLDDILAALLLVDRLSPREKLIEQVDKALTVYAVRQAQIIQVSFRWRNPRVAPVFLDRFLALYLETVNALNGRGDSPEMIDEQIRRAAGDLDAAERERHDLDVAYAIVDLKQEKQTLAARIDRLTALLEGTPPAPPSAQTAQGRAGDAEPIAGVQMEALRAQVSALRIERAKAEAGFTPDSRQMRELDGQIAAAEDAIATGQREIMETLATLRARMQVLQSVEAAYDRVGRNIDIASEAFQTYRKAAEDRRFKLAEESKLKIQIVDPPTTPMRPVGWSRLLLVVAGFGFSVAAATALIGLQATMQRKRREGAAPSASPLPLVRPQTPKSLTAV